MAGRQGRRQGGRRQGGREAGRQGGRQEGGREGGRERIGERNLGGRRSELAAISDLSFSPSSSAPPSTSQPAILTPPTTSLTHLLLSRTLLRGLAKGCAGVAGAVGRLQEGEQQRAAQQRSQRQAHRLPTSRAAAAVRRAGRAEALPVERSRPPRLIRRSAERGRLSPRGRGAGGGGAAGKQSGP